MLDEFQARFEGKLCRPGEADFDEVRKLWDAIIDHRPVRLYRCDGLARAGSHQLCFERARPLWVMGRPSEVD